MSGSSCQPGGCAPAGGLLLVAARAPSSPSTRFQEHCFSIFKGFSKNFHLITPDGIHRITCNYKANASGSIPQHRG